MPLENVIVYAAVLALPLWLVVEEVLHRFVFRRQGSGGRAAPRGRPARFRARTGGVARLASTSPIRLASVPLAVVRRPLYSVRTSILNGTTAMRPGAITNPAPSLARPARGTS